ncbi:fumarate hydratase [Cellulosilyticum lentocellum]|uniref:Hydro-lyase, Fe-S type, tartrate/fumarate subfamily, alpha subunit n=1 Tax=Cellulosilyticum lentocellum (strain ATCC 49066 / DSM 5427 / NCIMB 11756 / RHM5) TaxID=642492 RepID=F2JPF3_CELLD|nr:fumarate hydratase [Cellulosilyticum lentocellum]ADZ82501.1 hydro-lyase, Fe-S type, tartrate/fumarate subfamily, alpha subunit [Cellulosilyticum lentocellum DSM 5427]
MRSILVSEVTAAVKKLCIEANYYLPDDIYAALKKGEEEEISPVGKDILTDICTNADIAKTEDIPICQDTGTAVVFVKIGQEVHLEGGLLTEAINEGVRQGYTEGYLRKSIVENPLYRVNTKDNTPAIIHYEIVEGENIDIMLAPKGGGSENMSKVYMLTPSQGVAGVKKAVLEAVTLAGPNACLPVVVGIGIGGNFEKCTLLAKTALTREIGSHNKDPRMAALETELLEEINKLGIGPQGLGGVVTALAVHIEDYPCHIASMPLAINMGCHVNRHKHVRL